MYLFLSMRYLMCDCKHSQIARRAGTDLRMLSSELSLELISSCFVGSLVLFLHVFIGYIVYINTKLNYQVTQRKNRLFTFSMYVFVYSTSGEIMPVFLRKTSFLHRGVFPTINSIDSNWVVMSPLDNNQVGLESEDENIPLCPESCMRSI
jgi:hypothetical protein